MIETERLILRRWREEDVAPYAAIRAQPEIARWLTPITHIDEVISRINRYDGGFDEHGIGRWAVERRADGALIGACGILPAWPTLPVSPALDLGWHLSRDAWGHGYASEAARAALAATGDTRIILSAMLTVSAERHGFGEFCEALGGLFIDPPVTIVPNGEAERNTLPLSANLFIFGFKIVLRYLSLAGGWRSIATSRLRRARWRWRAGNDQ